jgi:hypothetical protein
MGLKRIRVDRNGLRKLRNAEDRAVHRVAEEVKTDARRYAPVDTGTLRDSIHVEDGGDGTWQVVAGVDYAVDVELGHHLVAWGNDTNKFVAPQPFLRPALYTRRSL